MNGLMVFRVAVRALLRNKMRSFLTLLGIIIGVSAVIAMVAIGQGAQKRVEDTFASMGSSLIIVMSGSHSGGGAREGFGSMPTLTWEDLEAIRMELSSVQYASPVIQSRAQLVSEQQNWNTQLIGTNPEYFRIRSWAVVQGTSLTETDVEGATQAALLGQTVVEKLFGVDYDPVGQSVRISNVPFVVVGVLDSKGQSPRGEDYDDAVYIPYTTYRSRISGGLQQYIRGAIFVSATTPNDTSRAEAEITELLRERHHIRLSAEDDFSVRNLSEMAEAMEEGTRTFTTLLASIAAVSLLVGGIGIMNIMLVSVTERTREIGLRMAVGARPMDILAQFLVESLTLSITGGLVGVVLGITAARVLSRQYGWSMLVPPDIVLLAVGFSALVGVVFGLYPARKAAQLDPIEALRYE